VFSEEIKAQAVRKLHEEVDYEHDEKGTRNALKHSIKRMLQYPKALTPMFNENGKDHYKSSMMILVSLPSIMILLFMFLVLIVPIFATDFSTYTIREEDLDMNYYGIQFLPEEKEESGEISWR